MEAYNQDNSGNYIFYEADVCFQSPGNGHDEFVAERTSLQLSMSSADQSKSLHSFGRGIRSANLPATSSYVNTEREPRRFSFFSSERGSTVDATDIRDLVSPGESFYTIFDTGPTKGIWWLDILNPIEGEINALAKALKIHSLTSEDIKTRETREKVEVSNTTILSASVHLTRWASLTGVMWNHLTCISLYFVRGLSVLPSARVRTRRTFKLEFAC